MLPKKKIIKKKTGNTSTTTTDGIGNRGLSDKDAFERGSGLSKRDKTQLGEYDRPDKDGGDDGDGKGGGETIVLATILNMAISTK